MKTILISSLLAINTSLLFAENAPRAEPIVRVAIADDKDKVTLSLKGKYRVTKTGGAEIILEGLFLSANISAAKDALLIGKKEIGARAINISVVRDGNIYIDGRRFRGSVDIINKGDGKVLVVNNIPIDQYLEGVLYHEVSHRWPMEALKAQAITARTFALYQMSQSKAQPYDVRTDIYSQVYGGMASEKWSTSAAVNKTKGQVLTYKGNIFPTYYHATCGGHTEDAAKLWNVDLEPLKGVVCNFCEGSPHYKWTKDMMASQLEKKLLDGGYKIQKIASIAVVSKDISNRADKLEIKDEDGGVLSISGKDFRQLLGPNDIRSANFDISLRAGVVIINGIGWGHGVGMCQWGAYGMSLKGKKVDEILSYYYPGSEIATIDSLKK